MKHIGRLLALYAPLGLATAVCMTVVLLFIGGEGPAFHPEMPKVLTAFLLAVVVVACVAVLLNPLRQNRPDQEQPEFAAVAFEPEQMLR